MPYNPRQWQNDVKSTNENIILSELSEGPKRFLELHKATGFSATGLTKILQRMRNKKLIENTLYNGKQAYTITEKGSISIREIHNTGTTIINLIKNDAEYFDTYSNQQHSMWFCRLPWGIDDDLVVDKNIGTEFIPLLKKDVIELNESIYTKVLKNFKNKNMPFDENKSGTIILSFIIDYKELLKSIKQNSLNYYKNISEKELDILEVLDHGDITAKHVHDILKIRKLKSKGKTKVDGIGDGITK